MTESSSGEATGRALSWTLRVKKSALVSACLDYTVLGFTPDRGLWLTVPRLEPVVLGRRVAHVHVLEAVARLVRRVGHLHQVLEARLAEPADLVVAEHGSRLGSLCRR